MKALKMVISIVFIVGTIAIIFYDGKVNYKKHADASSVRADSVSQAHRNK